MYKEQLEDWRIIACKHQPGYILPAQATKFFVAEGRTSSHYSLSVAQRIGRVYIRLPVESATWKLPGYWRLGQVALKLTATPDQLCKWFFDSLRVSNEAIAASS